MSLFNLFTTFSFESYSKAMEWFYKNYNIDLFDGLVLSYLQDKFENNEIPLKEDLENYFSKPTCLCEDQYDPEALKTLKIEYLRRYGTLLSCTELNYAVQFYTLNKSVPTLEELRDYISNILEFDNDPEEFHKKDKIHVPTSNLDKLSPIIKDTSVEEFCSLCQEQIGFNAFYKLPQCNHLFHANKEKCLEDSCIIDWLSKHKFCPNCKTEVKID